MKTTFIPITYDALEIEDKTIVRIFGRTEKKQQICVLDYFSPCFYTITSKPEKLLEKIKNKFPLLKSSIENKKFLGEDVRAIKIQVDSKKQIKETIDRIKSLEKKVLIREHDIPIVTHYIISKKIKPMMAYNISGQVVTEDDQEFKGLNQILEVDQVIKLEKAEEIKQQDYTPKTIAYDIETESLEIGEGKITMVALAGDKLKKVLTWRKTKNPQKYVEILKDEKEMLERFIEIIKDEKPDILTGYFSDNFDLPYLRARAKKFKLKFNIGLDGSQPKFSKGAMLSTSIVGIAHVDLLRFVRSAYSQYLKSETLSLNEVASELIGEGKINLEHKTTHYTKFSDQQWRDFFEYNLRDAEITKKLFDKMWPDMLEFSKITCEPTFETSRSGLSRKVEDYIINNLEQFNEIIEAKPDHDEIGEARRSRSEGAFVLQPKPGLYENLVFFDFTSMHTSIIISFNISKSTLAGPSVKNSYESPELEFHGNKTKFYFSKKQGFIPSLLKEIFEKRKQYKEEYRKNPNPMTLARSNAFKVLSASVHGYQGFFGARYYSAEAANSTLAFVRKFNKETIEKTEKAGFNVIYADTDSVAFSVNKKSKKQILEFLNKLNSELPGIMHLELEGFFKRGLWVTTRSGEFGAKKKYALLDEKGKMKIRGFETVRRDWCQLARKLQNKVIRLILDNGNEKAAMEYTKEIIENLKQREIPIQELIIKSQLKKPISEYKSISPHVKIAKEMKEKDIPVSQGMLIQYYIAEPKPGDKKNLIRDRATLPEEEKDYDIDYYLNNQVLPAVENIFHVFDINIKEIIDGRKQMCLGDF